MARISWHPAFVQAIKHEFVEYREVLDFEAEHQLTTEPLKIDVLIITALALKLSSQPEFGMMKELGQ